MQKMAVKQARYRAEAARSKGDLRLKNAGLAIEQGKIEIECARSELGVKNVGFPFKLCCVATGISPWWCADAFSDCITGYGKT